MKEPRPEAETSGDAPAVANQNADVLERDLMALIAFDISEQRAIVARLNAPKMRRQNFHEGLGRRECLAVLAVGEERNTGLFEQRRFRRQLPGPLVRGGELARLALAGLDIRLIEWIDAEDRIFPLSQARPRLCACLTMTRRGHLRWPDSTPHD